jgi:sarcosine oxidase
MQRFETIVLGLGAMGSATAYQLAKRGHAVLGIDQFSPPHALGSTHGDTRVTRQAIGEGDEYVALACRSHAIWRALERETGCELFRRVGCLIISSDAPRAAVHVPGFFATTVATARRHGIAHELLGADAIRRRYPQFAVRDDEFAYFEPGAGFLWVEECVRAQLTFAAHHGARILTGARVERFEASAAGVTVTANGADYSADRLILAAGAWLPALLGEPWRPLFGVSRQTLLWFDLDAAGAPFLAPDCPVFMWELQGKAQSLYGFPAVDGAAGGVKVASEQYATTTTPEAVDRDVSADEIAAMHRDYVAGHLAGVS